MIKHYHVTQIKSLELKGPFADLYWFDVVLHPDVLPVTRPQVAWELLEVSYDGRGYILAEERKHADYLEFLREFKGAKEDEVAFAEMIDRTREKIIADFTDKWALNDRAHRIEHFQSVEATGLHINRVLGLDCDPYLIMMAAFFHDMFAWSRHNHEWMSSEWVATTDYPIFQEMEDDEVEMLADACREHRASYEGEYSTHFSALIASADRGFPMFVTDMLERSKMYHLDALKLGEEAANVGAVTHLKEKFGTGGYARFPDLYVEAFGKDLEHQRFLIDNLTE